MPYFIVSIVIMLRTGRPGHHSGQLKRKYIHFFATASRPILDPTRPPIYWVPGVLPLGVKQPGREVDHSPPSSAEAKNTCRSTSTPLYVLMAWYVVFNAQGLHFLC